LLSKMLRQFLCDQTGEQIGCTARCVGHDDSHRSHWIGLRVCNTLDGRQDGSAASQVKEFATGKLHGASQKGFGAPT
jgi:hypothetical protein